MLRNLGRLGTNSWRLLQAINGPEATGSQLLDQLAFVPDGSFELGGTAPQAMLRMGVTAANAA